MNSSDNAILTFITTRLNHRATLPDDLIQDTAQLLAYRYLDAGHIDSFDLLHFRTELENEFDIEFTPEDTQSDHFRTLGGLVNIIQQHL